MQATKKQILLTGHSAGAMTAELLAAHHDLPAITFDGPGKFLGIDPVQDWSACTPQPKLQN
jgi:putative lipase involved disintegration of autophagic bodies